MDLPNWLSLERVGRPDFRAATGQLVLGDFIRHNRNLMLPEGRANSLWATNYDARIFDGFGWTTAVSGAVGTLVMNRGSGLFPYLDPEDNTVKHCILFADEGPDTVQVDFSGATDPGTTDVYVRLVRTPATFGNRVFWNPSGAPAQEYVSNIPTRLTFQWEVTIQDNGVPSPGGEWVKVWEIAISGGNFTGSTDFRHSYFEGSPHPSDAYAWEWGYNPASGDRNADRTIAPVTDMHRWVQAVRAQLAGILSSSLNAWYAAPAIALDDVNTEHYSYADSAAHAGKHKQVTFGLTSPQGFWLLGSAAPDAFSFVGQDQSDNAALVFDFTPGSTKMDFYPRGVGVGLTNLDDWRLRVGNPGGGGTFDWDHRLSKSSPTFGAATWAFQGLWTFSFIVNTSAKSGLFLGTTGHSFYRQSSGAASMFLPLHCFRESGASGWYMTGPNDGNVAASAGYVSLKTALADDEIFIEVLDFPEDATLSAIQVFWAQAALGAGAREMRMYAARHTQLSVSDGDVPAGFEWAINSLKAAAPANYIEYSLTTHPANVLTFTCDQNNGNWTKYDDKLVLGFRSPDVAVVCTIYSVRLYWDYEDINPWTQQ